MSADIRLIITADEAASLIPDGGTVHNYANPRGGVFLGVDYDRIEAIEAFRAAAEIEIGGSGCRAMGHPIAVWEPSGRVTFFEADMGKLAAFEASRTIADEAAS